MTRRSNSREPSCAEPRAVIVVARAARQLAAAARSAGWLPLVADAFGDADLRAVAVDWQQVSLGPDLAFRPRTLLGAVTRLRQRAPSAPLVWGSGFEGQPNLLHQLAAKGPVLGTPPAVLALMQDPGAWSRLLRRLAIPHPAVALREVPRRGAWVAKRSGVSGGAHVRFAAPGSVLGTGEFAQQCVGGRALSAVFVAGAREVRLAGYCEQLFSPVGASPFRHAGAIALPDDALPRRLRAEVQTALQRLTTALALRGLCGIDFVLQPGGAWQLIELNARAPSSFDLHATASSMFRAHLAACRGDPLPMGRKLSTRRARAVHYASSALRIVNSIDWPAWVADRPPDSSEIAVGAPVCTVSAAAATPALARQRLDRRLDRIRGWLGDADRRRPLTSHEILAGEHTHE